MASAGLGNWGGHSMVWRLKRVLVYPPVPPIDSKDWRRFGYVRPMNHRQAVEEHLEFRRILSGDGIEVITGEIDDGRLQDAIFPFDPVFITNAGAILCRMGKDVRESEIALAERTMVEMGVPIAGRIEAPGRLEGGDCLWIDESTLAIGRGYRTNQAGIDQMSSIMAAQGVHVISVGLPHWRGSGECLHLLSLISMLDDDLAVVYLPLLEASFVERLGDLGITLIAIPEHEFPTQGSNVLVTEPRRCILLRENPITAERLKAVGCEVTFYTGGEISHNRSGGPTCLTRPILRER